MLPVGSKAWSADETSLDAKCFGEERKIRGAEMFGHSPAPPRPQAAKEKEETEEQEKPRRNGRGEILTQKKKEGTHCQCSLPTQGLSSSPGAIPSLFLPEAIG
jgi:hypothetical protein